MREITWFASARFMQIAYIILILSYIIMRDWKRSIEIAVIGIGGFAVNYFMKLWFARERPPDPLIDRLYNFSFPSGHATSALIFYGLCAYLLWKSKIPKVWKWVSAVVLFLFSLVIGFSRVYLRVHFASDVLAGFCVGGAWLILIIFILERLKKQSEKEMAR
jgi:undecaprenyl-diphosphatase